MAEKSEHKLHGVEAGWFVQGSTLVVVINALRLLAYKE